MKYLGTFALLLIWLASPLQAKIGELKAEAEAEDNLEKRSDKAMEYTIALFEAASDAYTANDLESTKNLLEETRAGVLWVKTSLEESGKTPRKSKYYKRAEIKTRRLIRDLEALEQRMSYVDRPLVQPVIETTRKVNTALLNAIFSKKK